jgi:hypothetical protein
MGYSNDLQWEGITGNCQIMDYHLFEGGSENTEKHKHRGKCLEQLKYERDRTTTV